MLESQCKVYAEENDFTYNGNSEPPLVNLGSPLYHYIYVKEIDSDTDCAGDLICYEKLSRTCTRCSGEGAVPASYDFCYMPYPASQNGKVYNYVAQDPPPIGMCEADCDADTHCEGDLKCFQRVGDENVPGCDVTGAVVKRYMLRTSAKYSRWLYLNNQ